VPPASRSTRRRRSNTPEWIEQIAALQPDLILSVYYRNMISSKILALPRLGAFNLMVPSCRDIAVARRSIGRSCTASPRIGMTLHRMVKAPDAGAIVDQEGVDIGCAIRRRWPSRKVLPCGRRVIERQIDALLAGTAKGDPTGRIPSHVFWRTQARGRPASIGRRAAARFFNLIRAVTDPYPGAFTDVGSVRLMVWWAETQIDRHAGPQRTAR